MRGRSLHRGMVEVKEKLVLSSMTTPTDRHARGNAGSGCCRAPIRARPNLVVGCGADAKRLGVGDGVKFTPAV
jgi:hypothetical protein